MTANIRSLGPENVSKHAANPKILNVMDVSIRRLSNPTAFKKQLKTYDNVRVLDENGVYHIEIKQSKKIKP